MSLIHRDIPVTAGSVHVVEAGDPAGRPVVFLHGWPQCWRAWEPVLAAASRHRAIALDLPGIGGSVTAATDGTKVAIADVVHEVVVALDLRDPVLVGHDAGGMVAWAYARRHPLAAVVIGDVVIPGLDPWDAVLARPEIWHFAFHASPGLPEMLVEGRMRPYADHFFDILSADPSRIADDARAAHAAAYADPAALRAGFDWYRAFPRDADDNRADGSTLTTPVLYLRGEHEGGDIAVYVDAMRRAGAARVEHAVVAGAGHFAPEEAPAEFWAPIEAFLTTV